MALLVTLTCASFAKSAWRGKVTLVCQPPCDVDAHCVPPAMTHATIERRYASCARVHAASTCASTAQCRSHSRGSEPQCVGAE